MSRGWGGWVLELRCTTCSASDTFRGVLLTLAGDLAVRSGWAVDTALASLARKPGERGEMCPKCIDTLRD